MFEWEFVQLNQLVDDLKMISVTSKVVFHHSTWYAQQMEYTVAVRISPRWRTYVPSCLRYHLGCGKSWPICPERPKVRCAHCLKTNWNRMVVIFCSLKYLCWGGSSLQLIRYTFFFYFNFNWINRRFITRATKSNSNTYAKTIFNANCRLSYQYKIVEAL